MTSVSAAPPELRVIAAVLDLDLSGWTMRGGDGQFALAADMPDYAMRLDVDDDETGRAA